MNSAIPSPTIMLLAVFTFLTAADDHKGMAASTHRTAALNLKLIIS